MAATSCSAYYALGSSCRVGYFPSSINKLQVATNSSNCRAPIRKHKYEFSSTHGTVFQSGRGDAYIRHNTPLGFKVMVPRWGNQGLLHGSRSGSRQQKCRVLKTLASLQDADLSEQVSGQGRDLRPLKIALAGAALVALDKGSATALQRWDAIPATLRALPSSTFSMLLVLAALLALEYANPDYSKSITSFFAPAIELLQHWMPLFYTPPLVLMSVLAPRFRGANIGLCTLGLTVGAWAVTLIAAALLATVIRKGTSTELRDYSVNIPSPVQNNNNLWEISTWVGVGFVSGLVAYIAPTAFGLHHATVASPFFLCATVVGLHLGSQVPAAFKRFLHPVITSAIVVNVAAYIVGLLTNRSFETALGLYVTNNLQAPGAGDVLMAFLGPLVISYAFTVFHHRGLVRRHAPELGAVIPLTGLFSIFITIFVGRQLGLADSLTSSFVGRSLSPPFTVPITRILGGDVPIATTAAVITGLLGANFSPLLLSAFKVDDGIARSIAVACSSHGYGSAAVSSGEFNLLPFCAISYILMGVVSTVALSIPVVRNVLLQV
jgi:putative effector of murein hydrolase/sorbitol-specific phosphotransferase system component IIC